MENKAVVLLSSGLDSSVNLAWASGEMKVALALTFDYGQLAAAKEISSAQRLCEDFGVPHQVIDLKWFSDFSQSALNSKQKLPVNQSIEDDAVSKETARSVWVPNRNGIFLNIAAGYAEGLEADYVIPGFNKEEAATFPDNSKEFLQALNRSFEFSTEGRVKVKCFTTEMNKSEIVARGLELGINFSKLWPCYQNFNEWCGVCESCKRFARALGENDLSFDELKHEI